ncbi:MAG: class I SAM-dependent methyltransferase, partial [Chloroflexota bacterium]|nr:class I SAM-dependent methyltransferase [Chloroflexota bacterium]
MQPKPAHLAPEYGAQFRDQSIADTYKHRPPYPPATVDLLAPLLVDEPRAVLDAGCGRGELARPLAHIAARVDAVDPSAALIAHGRALPGGNHPALSWILGAIEDATLRPPYALITAGASLHWMDGAVVLSRMAAALTPRGALAIVDQHVAPSPWDAALQQVINEFSTNRDYQPYDLVEELESRLLFRREGERRTEPIPFVQSVAEYVESFHARNGFSRERVGPDRAVAFDAAALALVRGHRPRGEV